MFRKIFKPEFVFFFVLLVTGLFIYDDYGLSFDEAIQRTENGNVNYHYIVTGNNTALFESPEKYHGPAFEIFLVFVERTFNITDDRSIFLSRHLFTFLLFFTGIIFFYLLAHDYFNNKSAALLSCAILILTPRIFADSFYNSKDIPFLSVFIISIYFLTRFLKKQNFFAASMHGLFTGLLIDIRILGVLVPVFTVIFFTADRVFKISREKPWIGSGYLLLYLFLSAIFTILFWPVLWTGPVPHFLAALSEMSKFPWNGDVVYMGKLYLAEALPWHYPLVWIVISTPLMYSILFFAGVGFVITRLVKSPAEFYRHEKESIIFIAWFFVPLLAVILLNSIVYDGWRHLYFTYPAFVLLSVRGFYWGVNYFEEKSYVIFKRILKAIMAGSLGYITVLMIISHPYQNIYFNFLAGNPEGRFERDYWGLSFHKGLEHILETDTSNKIMFTGSSADVPLNRLMLPQKVRERLLFTSYFEFADYYLDNFRWNRWVNQPIEEVFFLKPMDVKIMSVYKVLHNKSDRTLLHMENDFEKNYQGWDPYKDMIIAGAVSGQKVCKVDSNDVYSAGITVHYDSLTKDKQALAVYASLQALVMDADSVPLVVISVSNDEQKDLYWTATKFWTAEEIKPEQWKRVVVEAEIPKNVAAPNQLKVYIWNPFKSKIYVDDFTVKIVKAN